MKNIFIDGYYDKNFGDDLMLYTLIMYMSKSGFNVYVKKSDEFLSDFKSKIPFKIIELDDDSINSLKKNKINAYITVGGSMFPHDSIKEGIFRYVKLLKYVRLKSTGIKICVLNCSISWNNYSFGINATKMIFKICDFITCRDKSSYDFIRKYNKNTELFPDILFHKLKRKRTSNFSQGILGVSSYMGYKALQRSKNIIIQRILQGIINEYLKKNESNIVKLFSFDGGYNSDLVMAHILKDHSIDIDRVEIIGYNGDIEAFLNDLNTCSFFIGTRFHSLVYALANFVPFIPLVYEKKSESLLKDLNYKGEVFYLNDKIGKEKMINFYFPINDHEMIDYMVQNSQEHLIKLTNFLRSNI